MTHYSSFVHASLVIFISVLSFAGLNAQKLKLPVVEEGISGTEIMEVGFSRDHFYVDLAYFNDSYYSTTLSFDAKNPYYVEDRATGTKYALLEPLPDASKPIKVCDRCTTVVRMKFQKLPASTRSINLIQGGRTNGWHFRNIDFSKMYAAESASAVASGGTKFFGIIFDEELREYGVCNLTIDKDKVHFERHMLRHLAYRDFEPQKIKATFVRCGNKGKYCAENNKEAEIYFTLRDQTDAYNLDGDGFLRFDGIIRFKFFLLDKKRYKTDYEWLNGQLWVGEKLNGLPNGFGAFVSLQKQYSHYTERANKGYQSEKESLKDYKDGYPYIRIGRFENGVFMEGSTHIYYTFDKHSYPVDGYNKIVAPNVNGSMQGGGLVYRWAYDPYEEAFSNVYIGKMDGLFFADGEVKGYNFKNELAEQCMCAGRRLSCQRLKSTIEEQKFAEILGVATIAVAEVNLLLKVADKISGPSSGSGGATIPPPSKSEPGKGAEIKKNDTCAESETTTDETVKVCDNVYSVKRVKCQDGEKRDYFFIEKSVSCGLIGGSSKGYFKPSYYMGANVGQTFLATDYDTAIKKLCKCN